MQKIRKWINGLSVKAKLIIYAYLYACTDSHLRHPDGT